MVKLSPVVIFCYQRIKLLKLLVESLKKNQESTKTILYIFCDGYKNSVDKSNVIELRKYIKNIKGFKKIIIIKRRKNLGLSGNIIAGVECIFKKYNSAIFLEDDLIVSKDFLKFMNYALNFYSNNRKVWHISGWNYSIDNIKNKLCFDKQDAYLWRVMNCWGWGTWKNRWKFFKKNPDAIIKNWNNNKIKKFNLDGNYNFFSQIVRNKENKINTWAIFWYATIFNHKGLCLNPKISLTKNNGFDKFSTHSPYKDENNLKFKTCLNDNINLPKLLKEDSYFVNIVKNYLKNNYFKKMLNYLIKFLK
jgi:hypothetical protein